jgi:hypothetical protein
MAAEQPTDGSGEAEDFDTAQQHLMVEIGQELIAQAIGQELIAQATSGTVALELVVVQESGERDVGLDIQLSLERQSGLTVPATAEDALVEAVQRLVLLWRRHERDPWRRFTYRLTRGVSGPQFTSEFSF